MGFIAIKKNEHSHLIWTQRAATASERARLIEDINGIQGFVGEMSDSTVEFVSGLPIEHVFQKGTVTVTKTSNTVMHVGFVRENQWAQICYGSYKYEYAPGTTAFRNTIKTTDYEVDKSWGEGQQPPEGAEIQIQLSATIPGTASTEEPNATPEHVPVALDTIGVNLGTVKLNGGQKDGDAYTGNDTTEAPWKYKWENLPQYDKNGNEITYSAEEKSYIIGETTVDLTQHVPSYTVGTEGNSLVITNIIPKTTIKVLKTWAGGQTLPEGTSATLTLSATVPGTATDENQNPDAVPVDLPESVTAQIVLNGGKSGGDDTTKKPWEYEWTDLPEYDQNGKKITYSVTETKYTIGTTEYTTGVAADSTPKDGYQFSFTNTVPTEVIILKVDKKGNTLTGAKFVLKQYKNENYQELVKTFDEKEVGSEGENKGKLTFENLTAGYYELVETKEPTGYVISGEAPRFRVVFDTEKQALKVEYTKTEGGLVTYNSETNTFTVINEAGSALPQTGGIGTSLFTTLGAILTSTAGAALVLKKRKEE